mmetsp:Transcript_27592/g.39163  ORF Transcript_27592/g.39163 Transcript_27592/m.39163 type:complete len:477 (-) Transcript_27592:82-1512(-)
MQQQYEDPCQQKTRTRSALIMRYLTLLSAVAGFALILTYRQSLLLVIQKPFSSLSASTRNNTADKSRNERPICSTTGHIGMKIRQSRKLDIKSKNILVTGGAGYIATHTIICLLEAGYDVTVVDNLINSNEEGLRRVRNMFQIESNSSRLVFHRVDICDANALEKVFQSVAIPFKSCIHFAGLKAVGESVEKPLLYYHNNLMGTINLLSLMDKYNCRSIVFSSSATVYGSAHVPITEETPVGLGITNPYGRTKFMLEDIIKDFKKAKDLFATKFHNPSAVWSVVILRYFNPVGAHPSGRIGEDPNGIPNNLMPYLLQVAVGKRDKLTIFGTDYPTKDGTGVRDYIHVMDLAEGHVAALAFLDRPTVVLNGTVTALATSATAVTYPGGLKTYSVFNLGSGVGYSVMEIIAAMKRASKKEIPYLKGPRREGDIAVSYTDPTKALKQLNWQAHRSLDDMCRDAWNWQNKNPNGYNTGKL